MVDVKLENFLDEDGRVTRWPIRKNKAEGQRLIIEYLATKFETGREYTEKEVNAILNQYHTFGDWALLRRELFDRGYFNRTITGTTYWLTPNVKMY